MVRKNWQGRVCLIVVLMGAVGVLVADEVAGPPPQVAAPRTSVGGKVAGPDAAICGAIAAVLRAQQDAWNGGDVRAFMDHYWKNDDLTFSSGGKTTRGWQATLDHYLKQYPTREKMGRLMLSGLEITPLGDAAALVLGQWKLDGLGEPVGGNFTLVFREIDGRWVIVHDHTSRLAE